MGAEVSSHVILSIYSASAAVDAQNDMPKGFGIHLTLSIARDWAFGK